MSNPIIRNTHHLHVNDFEDSMHGVRFLLIFSKDTKRIEEFLDEHDDDGNAFLVRNYAGAVHQLTYNKQPCIAICLPFDSLNQPAEYAILAHEVTHASICHFKRLKHGLPVSTNKENDEELLCHHIQYLMEWCVCSFKDKKKFISFLPNDNEPATKKRSRRASNQ